MNRIKSIPILKTDPARLTLAALLLVFLLNACAKSGDSNLDHSMAGRDFLAKHMDNSQNAITEKTGATSLPLRFQKATLLLDETEPMGHRGDLTIPVGADISTTSGPVPLREIMKKLAQLKEMNVSWASDADQAALVDVDIRAEDDFFAAMDNLLRQLDYFFETNDNTIIVKHKETRRFHIAMPFMAPSFSSGVGGDVLGGTGGTDHEMTGTIQLTNTQEDENSFAIWSNIRTNLDLILEIWTNPADNEQAADPAQGQQGEETASPVIVRTPGKGYYTIDRPIGLITVTAPRSLLTKITSYIENLKKELYRQVSIEAKIIEVTLSHDNTTGINWENLLQNTGNPLSLSLDFQRLNPLHHTSGTQNKLLTINTHNFALVLDAIKEQGHVEVLANPKISVMNGQPAMISVGENMTYIDKVTASQEEGVVTYSIETSSVMSGLGMGVIATIMGDDQVVLTLTPVTSKVKTPIDYKTFTGTGGSSEVGLPKVAIREMTTMVKINSGNMLIVGGLIDTSNDYAEAKVAGLGDLKGVNRLFGQKGTNSYRKELIILLRPIIL